MSEIEEIKLKEFQVPYLYMLKSLDYNVDEIYRYRLITQSLLKKYDEKDPEYLYLFGLLPCDLIPAAYIPFNYKNFTRNFNRISKNDLFRLEHYKKVYGDGFELPQKDAIKKKFNEILKDFDNPHTLYNFEFLYFTMNIIILWIFVVVLFMYIFCYYYNNVFNYIMAGIIFALLTFSIVWKMIYTMQL
jgi:hypothetical protein